MFLHLSVSHSVHRGGCLPSACLDTHTYGQTSPPSRHPPPGRHPPPAATAANGRHPTGMHSCCQVKELSPKDMNCDKLLSPNIYPQKRNDIYCCFLPSANGVAKVMFSVLSVCPSVSSAASCTKLLGNVQTCSLCSPYCQQAGSWHAIEMPSYLPFYFHYLLEQPCVWLLYRAPRKS